MSWGSLVCTLWHTLVKPERIKPGRGCLGQEISRKPWVVLLVDLLIWGDGPGLAFSVPFTILLLQLPELE